MVVKEYFTTEASLADVARITGLSRQGVRRQIITALDAMWQHLPPELQIVYPRGEVLRLKEHRAYPVSRESRIKMSESHRGKPSPVKGYQHTPETRTRLVEAATGRRHTDETKAKMAAAHQGMRLRPETKEKMSLALRGRVFSSEHRAKISESLRRRPHTEKSQAQEDRGTRPTEVRLDVDR